MPLEPPRGDPARSPSAIEQLLSRVRTEASRASAVIDSETIDALRRIAPRLSARFDAEAPSPTEPMTIQRPIVIGTRSDAGSFEAMAQNLAGRAYAVYSLRDHQFHIQNINAPVVNSVAELRGIQTFLIQLSGERSEGPGAEMQEAMQAIERATGAPKVDLVIDASASKDLQDYVDLRRTSGQREVRLGKLVAIDAVPDGASRGGVGDVISRFAGADLGLHAASEVLGLGSTFVSYVNQEWPERFRELEDGTTLIAVSHDPSFASRAKLVLDEVASGLTALWSREALPSRADGDPNPSGASAVDVVHLTSFDTASARGLSDVQRSGVIAAARSALEAAQATPRSGAGPAHAVESWAAKLGLFPGKGSADQIGWLLREETAPNKLASTPFTELLARAAKGENLLAGTRAEGFAYLIVPGLFTKHYPGYMARNIARLEQRGLDVEIAPINTDDSTRHNVPVLRDAILNLEAKTGKDVILIGHSKGCVDSADALECHPELCAAVAGVLALQGPFGGSTIAADIVGSPTLKELAGDVIRLALGGNEESLACLAYLARQAEMRGRARYPVDRVRTLCVGTTSTSPWSITAAPALYMTDRYGQLGRGDGLVALLDTAYPGADWLALDPPPGIGHADLALSPVPGSSINPGDATEALLAMLMGRLD